MIFDQYSHMDNDYKILASNEVKEILSNNSLEFVAMEKVHGTNFSFILNNLNNSYEINCCRRSGILKPNESFYSYQTMLNKFKPKIFCLFDETKKLIKHKFNLNLRQIQLYGELYGGNYPPFGTNAGSKMVQKGIYYSDSNEFIAFDLKYWVSTDTNANVDTNTSQTQGKYLDWIDLVQLLNLVSIPIAPVILQGSWADVSKLNPQFESNVYKLHNLPQIPLNYAEGYVIKPIKEIRYGENFSRLIWKFKNPNFSEIVKSETNAKLSNPHVSKLEAYVCETRYNNVKSKCIEGTKINDIIQLFYNDIWTDFMDDLEIDKIKLEQVEKKELEKKLRGFTNKFVRTRYSN